MDCEPCEDEFQCQNLGNVQFERDQDLRDVHIFWWPKKMVLVVAAMRWILLAKRVEAINYKLTFATDLMLVLVIHLVLFTTLL